MGGLVWLASYPKSGNTWMRAFLHNLLRNEDKPISPDRLTEFTVGDSIAQWYEAASDRPLADLTEAEIAKLRPVVHRKMTEAFPDSVFVKTHSCLGIAEGVPLITMEVTIGGIYIVRNPMDVCISMADHYGIDIDKAIEGLNDRFRRTVPNQKNISEYHGSWSYHVESWTAQANPALHVVRYEDMSASPQKSFGNIAAFLGLDPPADRLEKAIRFSSFDTLQTLEQEQGFREKSQNSEKFFRQGKAEGWRAILSPEQVEKIVSANREMMAKFGYLP